MLRILDNIIPKHLNIVKLETFGLVKLGSSAVLHWSFTSVETHLKVKLKTPSRVLSVSNFNSMKPKRFKVFKAL